MISHRMATFLMKFTHTVPFYNTGSFQSSTLKEIEHLFIIAQRIPAKHTCEDVHLCRHIVIISIQLSYLEVLIIVGRIEKI